MKALPTTRRQQPPCAALSSASSSSSSSSFSSSSSSSSALSSLSDASCLPDRTRRFFSNPSSFMLFFFFFFFFFLFFFSSSVQAVDRNKFRTCAQTSFCNRLREPFSSSPSSSPSSSSSSSPIATEFSYSLAADFVTSSDQLASFSGHLLNLQRPLQLPLLFSLRLLENGVVQLKVDEEVEKKTSAKFKRWTASDVLDAHVLSSHSTGVTWSFSSSSSSSSSPSPSSSSTSATAVFTTPTQNLTTGLVSHVACQLLIRFTPFTVSLVVDGQLVSVYNSLGLMAFEQHRERNARPQIASSPSSSSSSSSPSADGAAEVQSVMVDAPDAADPKSVAFAYDSAGMWEESHGGHTDSKKKGPSAIAGDFTFPRSSHLFGLPEHAADFNLKNTRPSPSSSSSSSSSSTSKDSDFKEPYRLYNLDVFEYELNEPMALYGAVPFVVSHAPASAASAAVPSSSSSSSSSSPSSSTTGVLWLNSAETFIDISSSSLGAGLLSAGTPQKHAHFISESGVLEAYLMPGPSPHDVSRQLAQLTGHPQLPPLFSIAYHQCRWNYKSQEDLLAVESSFDEHDLPVDVLWLDIEHTDAKKYFTWDERQFPHPRDMQDILASKGRRLVTIVDPHIKRDASYSLHNLALADSLYVRQSQGNVYEGWCWPGSVSYLDFLSPSIRAAWSSRFSLTNYPHSSSSLFVWNDMNEPSVFNGPEVTMPKDCLHHGRNGPQTPGAAEVALEEVEHRDVHNLYGYYNSMATYFGLKERDATPSSSSSSSSSLTAPAASGARPFVLTRSFFAGSQKYAAVWTGDNAATWSHLAASTPMILSLNVAGITFSGADVGGFFGDPEPELLVRWYQVAAYQPFFRGHAHIDTKRREPYLLGEPYTARIRTALRERYALLPYIYTVFFRSSLVGTPVARPLWMEFPSEFALAAEEQQFLLGDAVMVLPVTAPSLTKLEARFPSSRWYAARSPHRMVQGPSSTTLDLSPDFIPVFYRGGCIVPRRERARRSSTLMRNDPYTLFVALNEGQQARGDLYLDDGKSYDYQQGARAWREFSFEGNTLKSSAKNVNAFSSFASSSSSLASTTASPSLEYRDANTIERVVILGLDPQHSFTRASVRRPGSNEQHVVSVLRAADGSLTVRKPDAPIASDFILELLP